jgi:hypothetical protein
LAKTPSLPVGTYLVTAELSVAASPSQDDAKSGNGSEIKCWVSPNTHFRENDGVSISAEIGQATQTLTLSDLVSTTVPSDQIDLVCSGSFSGNSQGQFFQVTHASLIAIPVGKAFTAKNT